MYFSKKKFLRKGFIVLPILMAVFFFISINEGYGRTMPKERSFSLNKAAAGVPNTVNATHRISNILFTVTNWGFLGSAQDANTIDCETNVAAPSCQFPAGSNLEYLFQGAIWIGAIVDGDTLVSCGTDGWWDSHEYFPDVAEESTGVIWLGSTRPTSAYPRTRTDCYPNQFSVENSISEEDFIAYYADTNVTYAEVDPIDQRPQRPIGIEIEQKSYSWSYEYAEDFILFDFKLTNISEFPINDLWVAFHVDADVHHKNNSGNGAQDDMTGFLLKAKPIETIDSLEIKTAYIMDNDGDPDGGAWSYESVRGATGTRVVRVPEGSDSVGFNWWISNVNSSLDWGPQWLENYFGTYPGGGRGTPGGDAARYRAISNREFDYDQAFARIDYTSNGPYDHDRWISPLPDANAREIANGYDTRYTYSFGPFPQILPGDSLLMTVAYVGGEDLHVNTDDYSRLFLGKEDDPEAIQSFLNSLDFNDLALNATWAQWVYDNPGPGGKFVVVDGDTIYISGDDIPDFKGPPPPDSPDLEFEASLNNVKVIWTGDISEYTEDSFGNGLDFEGYRIYRSRSEVLSEFVLLGSFDRIDYDRLVWDPLKGRMKLSKDAPKTLAELLKMAEESDTFRFVVDPKPPYEPLLCPTDNGNKVYVPHAENTGCFEEDTLFQDTTGVGALGYNNIPTTFELHSEILDSTLIKIDSESGDTIYSRHYSFPVSGVLSSIPYYYSVTAFDYGDPRTQLAPLESSKSINMRAIYAINNFENVSGDAYVYPNPYVLDGMYRRDGWEDVNIDPAYSQRIYFANLPGECTIRIFTLDGDLVDKIDFKPVAGIDQPITSWDLISRNTQSVVSGIYLYSIDSDKGRQIGKFVVIK